MMQLDLLAYTLTPEEATPLPEPPAEAVPRTPRQQWYEGLADYYLWLMSRMMSAGIAAKEAGNSHEGIQAMRRYEINRLARLRDEAMQIAKGSDRNIEQCP
jgi:hypothetical protein